MVRPRSMSMPPEASAPVFTVSRPRRIGSACARTIAGKPSCAAPAAAAADWMNFLRLKVMVPPPQDWLLRLNHGVARLGRQAGRFAQPEFAPREVRAEHDRYHLVEGMAPAHALASHAAVRREDQPLRRDVLERLADEACH